MKDLNIINNYIKTLIQDAYDEGWLEGLKYGFTLKNKKIEKKTACCDGNYVFGGDNHSKDCQEDKITT